MIARIVTTTFTKLDGPGYLHEVGSLEKLFSALAPPTFRPTTAAHPVPGPVIGPMKSSNIAPALDLFTKSPQDPELRFRLVDAAANQFGAEDARLMLLDAWVKNTPPDPYAALVCAKWIISSAPTDCSAATYTTIRQKHGL